MQVNHGIMETHFLKKFIGDGLDGEIEMGAETQSRHGGPRLSIEARWRLEFAGGCRNDIFDRSRAELSDRSGGQYFDYTRVVNQ